MRGSVIIILGAGSVKVLGLPNLGFMAGLQDWHGLGHLLTGDRFLTQGDGARTSAQHACALAEDPERLEAALALAQQWGSGILDVTDWQDKHV